MGDDNKKSKKNGIKKGSAKDLDQSPKDQKKSVPKSKSPNLLKGSTSPFESKSVFSPPKSEPSDAPRAPRKRRMTIKEKAAKMGAASISTIVLTGAGH